MEFGRGDIVVHTLKVCSEGIVDENKYIVLAAGYKDYKFARVYCIDGDAAFVGRTFHFRHNSLEKYEC